MIEAVALVLFFLSFVGAFFNFFPHWAPKNKTLKSIYLTMSSVYMCLGEFILGMILLYLFA